MSTNPTESPSSAPLSELAPAVVREEAADALARSREPRGVTPAPVSRREAGGGVGPLNKAMRANPALMIGISFLGGLLAGCTLRRL